MGHRILLDSHHFLSLPPCPYDAVLSYAAVSTQPVPHTSPRAFHKSFMCKRSDGIQWQEPGAETRMAHGELFRFENLGKLVTFDSQTPDKHAWYASNMELYQITSFNLGKTKQLMLLFWNLIQTNLLYIYIYKDHDILFKPPVPLNSKPLKIALICKPKAAQPVLLEEGMFHFSLATNSTIETAICSRHCREQQ